MFILNEMFINANMTILFIMVIMASKIVGDLWVLVEKLSVIRDQLNGKHVCGWTREHLNRASGELQCLIDCLEDG